MVKIRGTKAGLPMKIITDASGKTRVVVDHKSVLKSLPVNKRIAAKKTAENKVRFAKNPRPKGG